MCATLVKINYRGFTRHKINIWILKIDQLFAGVEGGDDVGWEEYFDYIFPEDENARPNLKLLAMAKMWKKQKVVEEPKEGFEAEAEVKIEDMEVTGDDDDNEENPVILTTVIIWIPD